MKKIKDLLVLSVTWFLNKLTWPLTVKKFPLDDYDELHDALLARPLPFAVILNTQYGHGSNLGIKFLNLPVKGKRFETVTHASIFIGQRRPGKSAIVESVGEGFQVVSLRHGTVQKDEVLVLVPDEKFIPKEVVAHALEYIDRLIERDEIENIDYDLLHDFRDPEKMDCSEVIYQAIRYGFRKIGKESILKNDVAIRFGVETYAPADIAKSPYFKILYSNKKNIRGW